MKGYGRLNDHEPGDPEFQLDDWLNEMTFGQKVLFVCAIVAMLFKFAG